MMRRGRGVMAVLLWWMAVSALPVAAQDWRIVRDAPVGGGTVTSSGLRLTATVGDGVVGSAVSAGDFRLESGFLYRPATPSVVHLPAIVRE